MPPMFSAGHAIIPHILSILLTNLEVKKSLRECRCECGRDYFRESSFWTFLFEVEVFIDYSSVRAIQYCHSYEANCIPQTTNLITSGPRITNLVDSGHKSFRECRIESGAMATTMSKSSFWTFVIQVEVFLVPHRSRAVQYSHSYDAKWIPQTTNVTTEAGPHISNLVHSGHKS